MRRRAEASAPGTVARAHPRHVVLFAFVAGLLAGRWAPRAPLPRRARRRRSPAASPLASPAAGRAGRRGAAPTRALDALGPGALPGLAGRRIEARAIVLEPTRGAAPTARVGRASAAALAAGGRAADARDGCSPPPRFAAAPCRAAGVGRRRSAGAPSRAARRRVVLRAARSGTLRRFEAYQRRRGAHARDRRRAWRPTGARRGGLAGALDRARERAERRPRRGAAAAGGGAAARHGARPGRGDRGGRPRRLRARRPRAPPRRQRAERDAALRARARASGRSSALPLRARLRAALVLVALYVPLAGAGPSIQRAGVMGVAGLVAALAGRPASRWYALGLAAAVTLALNPYAAGEPGWQLSFAAVAA